MWPTILIGGVVLLALLPEGFAEKSKLLLHGLCAQTPGHTFSLGGHPLPFDARMTGIYTGVVGTLMYLAFRRRLLAKQLPSKPILAGVALLVVAMAADGFNSLLTDLMVWHPWTTTNVTRVMTGYGAGVALVVALVWLLSGTVFQVADRVPIMDSWHDLIASIGPLAIVGLVLWVAPGWLYVPFSTVLVASAWIVLGTLALVTILLLSRFDERIVRRKQLHIPGSVGLLLGLGIMLLLAFGRQWLESMLGIPSTL
jgi:uncharacterized membrane protein